ncbi:tannase and feruloyl esterase [Astrocystis sublimbata]|nr:tannase and feruloyl esterase [Astrocystis sublimbata]
MFSSLSERCVPGSFNVSGIFGTEILGINTHLVTNYSASVPSIYRYTQPGLELSNATFCNVTVSYTHPGQNDTVIVETWLPADNWNGRFQAVGGSGYAAGRFELSYVTMQGALGDGYATSTTDAGLGFAFSPTWALLSPGNVNMYLLQNLGYTSLEDQAYMSKKIIQDFYGKGPDFSYWNGCSQGGRQGLQIAQLYPRLYDGIAAGAPAINWNRWLASLLWAQQLMNMMNAYPYNCELDAIVAAAVSSCDGQDGLVDGIISDVDACFDTFDPFSVVGKSIDCADTGGQIKVTNTAAIVFNATSQGSRTTEGNPIWYGYNIGTDVTGVNPLSLGLPAPAITNCTTGTCTGAPAIIATSWLQSFIARDLNFSYSEANLTFAEFDYFVHQSHVKYESAMGTSDPDLTGFEKAGGKLLTFHGLADSLIPPKGSQQYYNAVASAFPDIDNFYRHFESPGLSHCWGGRGGQPSQLFAQLRAWVENGTAPTQTPVQVNTTDGKNQKRVLCPYPQKAQIKTVGGKDNGTIYWSCSDDNSNILASQETVRPRICEESLRVTFVLILRDVQHQVEETNQTCYEMLG